MRSLRRTHAEARDHDSRFGSSRSSPWRRVVVSGGLGRGDCDRTVSRFSSGFARSSAVEGVRRRRGGRATRAVWRAHGPQQTDGPGDTRKHCLRSCRVKRPSRGSVDAVAVLQRDQPRGLPRRCGKAGAAKARSMRRSSRRAAPRPRGRALARRSARHVGDAARSESRRAAGGQRVRGRDGPS